MLYHQSRRNNSAKDDGFTLLEIVIAVGMLFLLSAIGIVSVRNFDDRAKEAAVQRAAREVYNAARAKVEDGNRNTEPEDAAVEYNNSQTSRTINNNKPITTKVIRNGSNPNDLRVEAYYDGGRINAVYDPSGGEGGVGDPSSGGVIVPVIRDTVSQLTYNCDSTVSGHYLPIFNISDSTTVTMIGSDGSEKLVEYTEPNLTEVESSRGGLDFVKDTGFTNVSEPLTMNAGVTYTIKVYGTFTNLSAVVAYTEDISVGANRSFRDCLVSVDKLGQHSGITNINWLGGPKFTSVPTQVPPTLTNLDCIFSNAVNFNDSNISNWDVSEVTSLHYAFLYSYAFDQPLNWDTGNVSNFFAAFHQARIFNNGGKPMRWDTSSGTNMSSMFNDARKFNQNVSEYYDSTTGVTYWDTSNATNMSSTFLSASDFNNGFTGAPASSPRMDWNTSNVTSMASMFKFATSFNSLINPSGKFWNVSKVSNFSSTFEGATVFSRGIGGWNTSNTTAMQYMFKNSGFNQDLKSWNTAKVANMTEMFNGASKFNQNISAWNVAKVSAANRVDFNTGTPMASNASYQPKWVN